MDGIGLARMEHIVNNVIQVHPMALVAFDQVEDADLDAQLLCDKLGMNYDPNQPYTVNLIDTQQAVPDATESYTFVPTYDSVAELGKQEFASDWTPEEIDAAMSEQNRPAYEQQAAAYREWIAKNNGIPDSQKAGAFFNDKYARSFANQQIEDKKQKDLFLCRHTFTTEIGTNEHFLGTGLTKQIGTSTPEKQYGVQELLTFEKNPPTIKQRKTAGALKTLTIPARA